MIDREQESAPRDVSKTQRKREALDLQSIGARLVELDAGDLGRIPIPDQLADAISACKRIRSHEARRRQLQFIGKLMRRLDIEPIREGLAKLDGESAEARYAFGQLERWRDRLIEDDDALTGYLDAYPHADRQQLRQQISRVRKARDEGRRKTEARSLFRMLRETAEAR